MTNLFTAQADEFLVARGGQIGILPLMFQRTLPRDRSHQLFCMMGFYRKITVCNFRIFSIKLAETRTSLRLRSLRGSPAKAAVRRAFKPENVATYLTTEVSPLYVNSVLLQRALAACENAASA